jgi:hypothetical protein
MNFADQASFLASSDPSDNFRLVKLANLKTVTHLLPIAPNCWGRFRCKLDEVAAKLNKNFGWQDNHWVWLEIMKDAIWMWDAEIEPTPDDIEECFIARIIWQVDNLDIVYAVGFEMD